MRRKKSSETRPKLIVCEALEFPALNEVKWLSKHFTVSGVIWNYDL
jgi:hypothetical protein